MKYLLFFTTVFFFAAWQFAEADKRAMPSDAYIEELILAAYQLGREDIILDAIE